MAQEESKRLGGRMLIFMQKAQEDNTPLDYSLAGLELGAARALILSKVIAYNSTLKNLHLSRKGIQDKEGQDIARLLLNNKTLRKIELEGNCLGMQTARIFALALRKNKTLRFLDLESNNLTHDGEENGGVEEMIQALTTNTTLLSLNLGNNKLDEHIGRQFVDCLQKNHALIDFEFAWNNFRLEDIRRLQDLLRRNKAEYDTARLKEWKERKQMRDEDHALAKFYLEKETVHEQTRMEEEAKSTREREIDRMWRAMEIEDVEEKKRQIAQLMEAAEIRNSRGKKGKKRGGKKGKKKK